MDKRLIAKRVQGMSIDEAAQYLMNNYPVTQIAEVLADMLLSDFQPVKPIVMTQEEFSQHFKIRGFSGADNQIIERRGRPRKTTIKDPELEI